LTTKTPERISKAPEKIAEVCRLVPAIVYGAGKEPSAITLNVHEIGHLLENEEAYTSVLELAIDKKGEI
jgi:large subunit ribosomal protein L25